MIFYNISWNESPRDILTDLNIIQVKLPLRHMKNKNNQMSRGFYNQFKELKPDMDEIIENYRNEKRIS